MPPISPFLDDILTAWTRRGNDLRKAADSQKEELNLALASAENLWTEIISQRKNDRLNLTQRLDAWDAQAGEPRYRELLDQFDRLAGEAHGLHDMVDSVEWLGRAEKRRDTWVRRMARRAEALRRKQEPFHDDLTAWAAQIEEQQAHLEEFKQKESQRPNPLFVSRARKQPEVDFLEEHRATAERLGQNLREFRRSVNQAMRRVENTLLELEERSQADGLGMQDLRMSLLNSLKTVQDLFIQRRDEIFEDALVYEAGHRTLRQVQEIVNSLRCVEDALPKPKTGWARFLQLN